MWTWEFAAGGHLRQAVLLALKGLFASVAENASYAVSRAPGKWKLVWVI